MACELSHRFKKLDFSPESVREYGYVSNASVCKTINKAAWKHKPRSGKYLYKDFFVFFSGCYLCLFFFVVTRKRAACANSDAEEVNNDATKEAVVVSDEADEVDELEFVLNQTLLPVRETI